MLKGDFHMHTHFSPDCAMPPERLVRRCLEVGLNCIAVTDHNTTRGAYEVRRLAPFMVIIGEEVKTSGGEITGLFLQEEVPRGLSPLETVSRIREQGGLISIPHPFDHFRRSVIQSEALREVLPHVDIIEAFNARTTLASDLRRAQRLAQERGILVSAVSDAHVPLELGRAYVELPEFDGTPEGFKQALAQGRLVGRRINPLVHLLTTYTKLKARLFGKHPQ